MRTLRVLPLLALLATPLAAQDLQRPDGWKVRFDRAGSTEADLEMFVAMPPGWHITTGPAAIFWDPSVSASGTYRLDMEVFLFDPEGRREAFGLFLGGRDLEGPDQAYTYFLLRDGGEFLIKRRRGEETPTLQAWTAHPSVRSYADRGEDASVKNVLTVVVGTDDVRFSVNGEEVASLPRTDVDAEGIVGIRVNHRLNVHISRLEVTSGG